MNKTQWQQVDMIEATCTFLSDNRSVWTANARIGEKLEKLGTILDAVRRENAAFTDGDTVGYTRAQEAQLEITIRAILALTNEVTEWALAQNDSLLLDQVRCSASDINRLRQADRVLKLNQLHRICEAAAPGIPGTQLSAEHFRHARIAIDRYAGLRGTKRQINDARKTACGNIDRLLKSTTPILRQLDLLIRNYASSHPEFCTQYGQSRMKHKTGGRRATRTWKDKAAQKVEKLMAAEKTPKVVMAISPVATLKPELVAGVGVADTHFVETIPLPAIPESVPNDIPVDPAPAVVA